MLEGKKKKKQAGADHFDTDTVFVEFIYLFTFENYHRNRGGQAWLTQSPSARSILSFLVTSENHHSDCTGKAAENILVVLLSSLHIGIPQMLVRQL